MGRCSARSREPQSLLVLVVLDHDIRISSLHSYGYLLIEVLPEGSP